MFIVLKTFGYTRFSSALSSEGFNSHCALIADTNERTKSVKEIAPTGRTTEDPAR